MEACVPAGIKPVCVLYDVTRPELKNPLHQRLKKDTARSEA